MIAKERNIPETVFCVFCLVMTAGFIFEVPRFVFWAPTILFAGFIVYTVMLKQPIRLSVSAALLLVFGVTYVWFTYTPSQTVYYQSYIFLHSLFMFVIGFNLFTSGVDAGRTFRQLEKYMFAVSVMYLVYVAATVIKFAFDIEGAPGYRRFWSIWYPGLVAKTATGFCVSMMFALAWGTYMIFFASKRWQRVTGISFVVSCFIFNICTQTRLLVFLTPVMLAVTFIVWLIYRKKKVRLGFTLLAVCIVLVAAVLLLYYLFKDRLQAMLADTIFYRFVELGLRSTRWRYMNNVIKNFSFSYLGGGVNSATVGVPHNFWLYVYDFGGIVPFAAYTVFTVFAAIGYIRFIKNRDLPTLLKIFLSLMLFVSFTEFMMEDLLYGLPSFVQMTHFLFGVACGAAGYVKPKETPAVQA